jgi:hypothetical protein
VATPSRIRESSSQANRPTVEPPVRKRVDPLLFDRYIAARIRYVQILTEGLLRASHTVPIDRHEVLDLPDQRLMRLIVSSKPSTPTRRALIIIPGKVNYFYNLSGRRIGEALSDLGFAVDLCALEDCPDNDYEWSFVSNISEVLVAYGDEGEGLARLRTIGARCQSVSSLSLECVATPWYQRIRDLSERAGASLNLDLGMHDQSPFLERADRAKYRFVFSGLTRSEQRQLDALSEDDTARTIPWSFVGHTTPHRAALVDHLVQSVDPRGFVYTPVVSPYTESGSPHLNQQQFERVLERTRYQIWCSHHRFFYMESERFRSSMLTGGVPVKIIESRLDIPETAPLSYLMMELGDIEGRLTASVFPRLRRLLRSNWRQFPTLTQEMARFLRQAEIQADSYASRAA